MGRKVPGVYPGNEGTWTVDKWYAGTRLFRRGFENFDEDDDELEDGESEDREVIEVSRSSRKKPQQSSSDRSLRSNRSSVRQGVGGENTSTFNRKKGTVRPTGPNSGQRRRATLRLTFSSCTSTARATWCGCTKSYSPPARRSRTRR